MNPYEINELESRDLYCEICEKIISTTEYLENSGICNQCIEKESQNMNFEIMVLENRINLLSNRNPVGNMRLINKLKRRLRKLTA